MFSGDQPTSDAARRPESNCCYRSPTTGVRNVALDDSGMTVIALLSVAPVIEDSMAGEVANAVAALDDHDVSYETNPMGTVIEADDIDTLLAAVGDAHKAVDGDRVSTFLKIDHKRDSDQSAAEKVDSVEAELGREAKTE